MIDQQEQSLVVPVSKAADLLEVCDAQIRAMLKEGLLQGVKIGREWRINRQSIVDFANGKTQPLQGKR